MTKSWGVALIAVTPPGLRLTAQLPLPERFRLIDATSKARLAETEGD